MSFLSVAKQGKSQKSQHMKLMLYAGEVQFGFYALLQMNIRGGLPLDLENAQEGSFLYEK